MSLYNIPQVYLARLCQYVGFFKHKEDSQLRDIKHINNKQAQEMEVQTVPRAVDLKEQ